MSSKRRLRRKSCKGKRRFTCKLDGDAAIKALVLQKLTKGYMVSYTCRFCKGWHIGRVKKTQNKALKVKNKRNNIEFFRGQS